MRARTISQTTSRAAPPPSSQDIKSDVSLPALLRLQSWMSSAFPIGAFSYSHGLETAIQDGRLHDANSTLAWIGTIAEHGSGWNDSVIMAHAWQASHDQDRQTQSDTLQQLNELALALQSSAERYRETTQLAAAFLSAARVWQAGEKVLTPVGLDASELALPIVLGWLGARLGLPKQLLLASTLQSMTSNLAWIATRLIPLGQSQCLWIIAELENVIETISFHAQSASLDELGSCSLLADIASLQHEVLPGRVCLT